MTGGVTTGKTNDADGGVTEWADAFSLASLKSSAATAGSLALASGAASLADEGLQGAKTAGPWAEGSILAKSASASKGAATAGRLKGLKGVLCAASKFTFLLAWGATWYGFYARVQADRADGYDGCFG